MDRRYAKHVAAVIVAMISVVDASAGPRLATRPIVYEAAFESERLARAKDLIAEEQWTRAIDELRLVVGDPTEARRDEAVYWLAHSLNQAGDQWSAVETVRQLERDFPRSMWVKPARSLRVEIAVRLNRSDVLWFTAMPQGLKPVDVSAPKSLRPPRTVKPAPPSPTRMWFAEQAGPPDEDLRVLALGALLKLEGEKAVPILGQIAFDSEQPGPAIRAVSMLAQSPLPKAREAVVEVAKRAATPEPVRLAAVRDLGRFGGPEASKELLNLYTIVNESVKLQIVRSLGERAEAGALVHIVETEKDGVLRFSALAGLGEAGGVAQLVRMYRSSSPQGKRSIVIGLFRARAESELIQVASSETDPQLRTFAMERLRLLGSPKARAYLQKPGEKR